MPPSSCSRRPPRISRPKEDQHHLEPDIKVKDIPCQEGADNTRKQDLKERVIAQLLLARIDIGQSVDRHSQSRDTCDHHHHSA